VDEVTASKRVQSPLVIGRLAFNFLADVFPHTTSSLPAMYPSTFVHTFQPSPFLSEMNSGTGFWLSIVRQVISAHGWEIAATEETTGGARFHISGFDDVDEL
jgi:hypothetical protein